MNNVRQIYALMPWWSGLPLTALGALIVAAFGPALVVAVLLSAGGAALAAVTWTKYRRREADRVARIVYFAHPERSGHDRLFALLVGQVWLGFFGIVALAALCAALFGPFGALVPAGLLAARNLMGETPKPARGTPQPALDHAAGRSRTAGEFAV